MPSRVWRRARLDMPYDPLSWSLNIVDAVIHIFGGFE
jgi:hypothetical protein